MANSIDKKIIFWGTPLFAVPCLNSLNKLGLVKAVVSQSDKPAGRGKKLMASPVKEFALANDLPVLEFDSEEIKKHLPATFVIVAFGKIIPQEVLDLSELSALNIHPSKLPILRGPSPIQTALLSGFESTAVSLMQLDEKMDHGPILGQIEAKIEPNDDYISLSKRLSDLGAEILEEKMVDYLSGKLESISQNDNQATFCQMIKKEDGKIDWTKSAQEIHNQVRAFRVWPSAFTKLGDLDLKIIKTEVVDQKLKPGEIGDNLIVGTNDKSLRILELQPAGKKIMTADEFLRGYHSYLDKIFQ